MSLGQQTKSKIPVKNAKPSNIRQPSASKDRRKGRQSRQEPDATTGESVLQK